MENGILRSCGLFALTVLCVNTSLSPVIAEQPQQTREGIITSFAPLVEKVVPSVVTVFTTQTVSRGQTAFSLARFSGQRLRVLRPGQR
jgi:S1-C subfamily serine protease